MTFFYRAIDPDYRSFALSGSRPPERYSGINQPTSYLSSSPEGVKAVIVMKSHRGNRSANLEQIKIRIIARQIFDLRNADALLAAGIELNDAITSWQEIVHKVGAPRSWKVRNYLESLGVNGFIDPSRKAAGLWYLALFS